MINKELIFLLMKLDQEATVKIAITDETNGLEIIEADVFGIDDNGDDIIIDGAIK